MKPTRRRRVKVGCADFVRSGPRIVVVEADSEWVDGRQNRTTTIEVNDMWQAAEIFGAARKALLHYREQFVSNVKVIDDCLAGR